MTTDHADRTATEPEWWRRQVALMDIGMSALGEDELMHQDVRALRDHRSLLLRGTWQGAGPPPTPEELRAAAADYKRASRRAASAGARLLDLADLVEAHAAAGHDNPGDR